MTKFNNLFEQAFALNAGFYLINRKPNTKDAKATAAHPTDTYWQMQRKYHRLPFVGAQPVTLLAFQQNYDGKVGRNIASHPPGYAFPNVPTARELFEEWRDKAICFIDDLPLQLPEDTPRIYTLRVFPAIDEVGKLLVPDDLYICHEQQIDERLHSAWEAQMRYQERSQFAKTMKADGVAVKRLPAPEVRPALPYKPEGAKVRKPKGGSAAPE